MLVWVRFGLDLDDVIIAAEESPKGISRVLECEGISLGNSLLLIINNNKKIFKKNKINK